MTATLVAESKFIPLLQMGAFFFAYFSVRPNRGRKSKTRQSPVKLEAEAVRDHVQGR